MSKTPILPYQIQTAAEVWKQIQNDPEPADRWLGRYFHRYRKKFGSHDRRFISGVIYGLFRHKTFCEIWADKLTGRPEAHLMIVLSALLEDLISPEEFLGFLRPFRKVSFPYPSLCEDLKKFELPRPALPKSPEEEMAIRFSFPLWLVKRWVSQFGFENAQALIRASGERPPLVIRTNPLKITREALLEKFKLNGLQAHPTPHSAFGIYFQTRLNLFDSDEFRDGLFEVQDEASQLVGAWVGAKPGELIWDVCAGGGGKSLLLAAQMGNQGRLIATDIREAKLLELKKRAKRAGIFNIFPAQIERVGEIAAVKKKGFDRILVDGPCSGTGTLRRNPDAKWKLSEEKLLRHHEDQLKILENVLPFMRPKTRLYYVTCSVEPLENEDVMREFLTRYPEIRPLALDASGTTGEATPEGWVRFWPDRDQKDGFFLAAVEKI